MCKFPVFEILAVKRWWPRSRTVQGQPRSNDMVWIDSAQVVFHSTSVDHIIVSVTIVKIFDIRFSWPWTRRVKSYLGSKFIKPMVGFLSDILWVQHHISHCFRDIWSDTYDLDLGRFKVKQGQRSWCQSIVHGWFRTRLRLTPLSYLSPFSKYLISNFNDFELRSFYVILGQSSQCHSKTHSWFPK